MPYPSNAPDDQRARPGDPLCAALMAAGAALQQRYPDLQADVPVGPIRWLRPLPHYGVGIFDAHLCLTVELGLHAVVNGRPCDLHDYRDEFRCALAAELPALERDLRAAQTMRDHHDDQYVRALEACALAQRGPA